MAKPLLAFNQRFVPWLGDEAEIKIGPIPAGTPVSLLSNLDLMGENRDAVSVAERDKAILRLADGFLSYPSEIGDATWGSAAEVLSTSEIAEIPYKLASWMQDKSRIALRYDGAFDPDRLTRFRYDEYGRWALTSVG